MTTRKTLNVGAFANDGTGDTLRDAADKINYNFDLLFDRSTVQNTSSGSAISESSGIVYFPSTPTTNTLPDGVNVSDKKLFVNNSTTGSATITGNFAKGGQLVLPANSACEVIWSGTKWILISNAGVSIT